MEHSIEDLRHRNSVLQKALRKARDCDTGNGFTGYMTEVFGMFRQTATQ